MAYGLFQSPTTSTLSGMLQLDAQHNLHWEQSGNPQGRPVVLLHGGPGAGIDQWHKQLLDPLHYRIIAYDQRGAGKSTPTGELHNNTSTHLVKDLELLRAHLGIKQWLVIGGSWGSSLALLYAQQHPDKLSGLILRGIFLCTKRELNWFLTGLQTVFPEAWRRFSNYIPIAERHDLLQAYYSRIHNPDPLVHAPASILWCEYEAACSTLLPATGLDAGKIEPQHAINIARLQTHYFFHDFFVDDKQLLQGTNQFRQVPAVIIQGRYDMICTIQSADQLHLHWPEADYQIVQNAGHAASEPGIRRALLRATEKFKTLPSGLAEQITTPPLMPEIST